MGVYEWGWAHMGAAEGVIHATDTTIVYIVCVIHTYMIKREGYIYIYIYNTHVFVSPMSHVIRCASTDACTCAVAIIDPRGRDDATYNSTTDHR